MRGAPAKAARAASAGTNIRWRTGINSPTGTPLRVTTKDFPLSRARITLPLSLRSSRCGATTARTRAGRSTRGTTSTRSRSSTCAGPTQGAFHDAYRTWAIRARLEREQGHFKNHVIWFGHVALMGDPNYVSDGIVAMDRWLAAVEADTSDKSLAEKIVADRPEDIQDKCSQVAGVEQVVVPGVGRVCENDQVQTRYGTPATVAGREHRHRHEPVPAQAAATQRLLPDRLHRRAVGAARGGVSDWRLRLVAAGRLTAGHDPVADVPGEEWRCHLRRPSAGRGPVLGGIRRRRKGARIGAS